MESSRNDLLDRAGWNQRVSMVTSDWRKKRQITREAGRGPETGGPQWRVASGPLPPRITVTASRRYQRYEAAPAADQRETASRRPARNARAPCQANIYASGRRNKAASPAWRRLASIRALPSALFAPLLR